MVGKLRQVVESILCGLGGKGWLLLEWDIVGRYAKKKARIIILGRTKSSQCSTKFKEEMNMKNDHYNEEKNQNENNAVCGYRREVLKELEFTISAELFAEVDINPYEELDLTVERGRIIIAPKTILGRIPEELLELYEQIGISREKVAVILGEAMDKAGGFDEMVKAMKGGQLD